MTETLKKDMQEVKDITKKTRGIATAIYMVSDLIKDSEPLRVKLRTAALELLDQAHYETGGVRTNRLIDLLEIGMTMKLVSQMNATILVRELRSLEHTAHGLETVTLDTQAPLAPAPSLPKTMPSMKRTTPLPSKDERKEKILSVIKDSTRPGGVVIKDIVSVFGDVSEKTIQRELVELVEHGRLKKVGEKRWSRYLLP